MLQNNLNRLMSERNIKATDLCTDTGLARSTIFSLSSGKTAGIQFETLEKICSYLRITPAELFDYSPYILDIDLDVQLKELTDATFQYLATISNGAYKKTFSLDVELVEPKSDPTFPRSDVENFELYVKIKLTENDKYSNMEFYDVINELSTPLKRTFYQQLINDIVVQLNEVTKKSIPRTVYDLNKQETSEKVFTKKKHCIIDIFHKTPCHRLADLELGTDNINI